jgi:hypothetical protein
LVFSIQYQVVTFWWVLYTILEEKSTEKGKEWAANAHEVAGPQSTPGARRSSVSLGFRLAADLRTDRKPLVKRALSRVPGFVRGAFARLAKPAAMVRARLEMQGRYS